MYKYRCGQNAYDKEVHTHWYSNLLMPIFMVYTDEHWYEALLLVLG
jgi:hypothetical protein